MKDQRLQEVKGEEEFNQKWVARGNFREQGAWKLFGNLIMVVSTWLCICQNVQNSRPNNEYSCMQIKN